MKYYSTQRPVAPGTYPKPVGNRVKEIHNFDRKKYCEEIDQKAWGYIVYERHLLKSDIEGYELIEGKEEVLGGKSSEI